MPQQSVTPGRGMPMVEADLIKEFAGALIATAAIVTVLALVFSSPDEPALTIRRVAAASPRSFAQTVLGYLDGTGALVTYGPPYNHGAGSVQALGPISPQQWAGVAVPVDPARDLVLTPLRMVAPTDPTVAQALRAYEAASPAQRATWAANLARALAAADARVVGHDVQVAPGDYGPIRTLIESELKLALDGALDGLLLSSGAFYQSDYSLPLLVIANSDALNNLANTYNLQGNQWGVMNETGNWPSQAWLWLYTFLYQIPPYSTVWAADADLAALMTISGLSLALLLLPWIPGLRDLPRRLRVYRVIWRDHYRSIEQN